MKLLKISIFYCLVAVFSGFAIACDSSSLAWASVSLDEVGNVFKAEPAGSIWADMGDHFALQDDSQRPEVKAQIALYQAHQEALYRILKSAEPYIWYVYQEARKKGVPAELALLPIIESEFNPHAKSNVGASGLWQIMPRTAVGLGLKSNRAYDGRKDVVASTDAALNYLDDLHDGLSNDWLLALAAYNCGSRNILNAGGRKNRWYKRSKFWDLSSLPRQTKNYVPKLLALSAIIRNPARYHVKLPPIVNKPILASVKITPRTDLKKIAQSSGMNVETLRKLNPGYLNLAATPGAPNTFLVPVENVSILRQTANVMLASSL